MADEKPKKIVVADENQLRTALRQQLRHNEQQNLAMAQMSRTLGRAGKFIKDLNSLVSKLESGTVPTDVFVKSISESLAKFNTTTARGSSSGTRG